ncbi:MAG: hypothetical protein KDA59_25285 [Planctomycetales bacterium]|nr:hypothetical protein [Planctomycetales bacterium]
MPQFAILHHTLPQGFQRPSHWDLMFEWGDALRTWAIEQTPDSAESQTALALPPHRLAYLTYEGPVSGNRGHVARWDEGHYTVEVADDQRLICAVQGQRLSGRIELIRQSESLDTWLYQFFRNRSA